jgi:DNA-binding NtrC family response regulator
MKDERISGAGPPGTALPVRRKTKRPRILVVDDEPGIQQLISSVLRRSGYQVDTAEDGAAGWEALQSTHYDLLITDNNMPKMSGVELVKMLRSAQMTLLVVIASGSIPIEALNGDSSLQLAATLLKPFTVDQLLGTVEKVLHVAKAGRRETVSLPRLVGAVEGLRL